MAGDNNIGPVCSVDGCVKAARTRGWCSAHYERWRKYGDLHHGPTKVCTVDGCDKKHTSKGLCSMHLSRLDRRGEVGAAAAQKVHTYSGAACSIEGCIKPAAKRGWCGMHYRRWFKAGDPGITALVRVGPGHPCEVCGSKTTGSRRYCSKAHAASAARSARGDVVTNCVRCAVELPRFSKRRGTGICVGCEARQACPTCGNLDRAVRGSLIVCNPCRRPNAQRDQLLRRARSLGAVCEHGSGCVSRELIRGMRGEPCFYCGADARHADHFEPLARGGKHCRDNLVPACAPCNLTKSDREPWDWWTRRAEAV